MSDKIQITTPQFRVMWPALDKPRASNPKYAPQYGLTAVFSPTKQIEDIRKACLDLAVAQLGSEAKVKAALEAGLYRMPYAKKATFLTKDGSRRVGFEGEGYALKTSSSAEYRPVLYGPGNHAIDADEIYMGSFARAKVTLRAYDAGGSKGIKCYLNSVQKLADGDRIGGGGTSFDDDYQVESEFGMTSSSNVNGIDIDDI